jgi:hypothetical protein
MLLKLSRLTPPNSPHPPTHYEDFVVVFVWVSFILFHLIIYFFLSFFGGMAERRENEN